ncbi:hypothetical protein [Rhodococcus opacus]|nr:hypothetical protein [Rhodococcus opacus]MDJ0420329.1 hypothetical protein [Rhodococcus opacus]MDV7089933.1 hypothetical protein [Rhodococcus opacus]QZS52410.1 hypothetical protein FXW36_01970 [Rhodococcus opacus]
MQSTPGAVLVAHERDGAVNDLRVDLPPGYPFNDPEVAQFGVHNAVMP